MDLDYRALSAVSATIKKLSRRWFVMRNLHATEGTVLVLPRYAISWMRGPLTRVELRAAMPASTDRCVPDSLR